MPANDGPSPTGWAVLGLLSFGRELSGYELKKWADGSLRFFYGTPAISQIYSELKRLQDLGYATSRIVVQEEIRSKRVYQITDEGTAALKAWVEDSPVEPPALKHNPMLRLWLGHLAETDRMRDVLAQHRVHAVAMAELAQHYVDGADMHQLPMPAAVLKWAERFYANEIESVDLVLEGIEHMKALALGQQPVWPALGDEPTG